jgi:PKHD-type hydroxylase
MTYKVDKLNVDADRILKYASDKWKQGKTTGKSKTRKSDVVITEEPWIYDIIKSVKIPWGFRLSSIEPLQITRYAESDYYDYHIDGDGITPINSPNTIYHGKTRKVSMSILLNDDFEGGEFEFYPNTRLMPARGDVIIFPSYILHRVAPVTSGVRYSLVAWMIGDPCV